MVNNNNNNSNSNTNNNNKQCQICLKRKKNSTARCFFSCKGKTCNKCINKVRKSRNPSCPTCRENIRQPGARARRPVNYSTSELYARVRQQQMRMMEARRVAAAARAALAAEQRPNFMEPIPLMNRMVARRGARTGSVSPPPRLQIPQSNSNSNNNNTPARPRRSRAPSPEANNNMPSLHTGGLVRKTAPHRLLKDEIVLSRAQRKGLTHGQIVKILKSYKKSK